MKKARDYIYHGLFLCKTQSAIEQQFWLFSTNYPIVF